MGRERGTGSKAWPIVGSIAIWLALWVALPGLDPGPRGHWFGQRRTAVTLDEDGTGLTVKPQGTGFERPWCPLCAVVEDHLTDNTWVNQTVGIAQLAMFAAIAASGMSLVNGHGPSLAGRRRSSARRQAIDQERIERAVERSKRARRRI